MKTAIIKNKLQQFIETAEVKRLKAIYALSEDEISQDDFEYTEEFKKELDLRFA